MKVGRPFVYSGRAIETILTLRELFRLTYRSTEGFVNGVVQLMQIQVAVPGPNQKYSTSLAKRAKTISIALNTPKHKGSVALVVDSTGLKVYGEGKCSAFRSGLRPSLILRKHGGSNLPPLPRDEAIRGCRKLGRAEWKRQVGYHRRSLAETAIYRTKTLLGSMLKTEATRHKIPKQY